MSEIDFRLNMRVLVTGPNIEGNLSAQGMVGRIGSINHFADGSEVCVVDLSPDEVERDLWEFHPTMLTRVDDPPVDDLPALEAWLQS